MRRRLGYEFFKAMHFFAAIVFIIVFFWHCDYTLTSWYVLLEMRIGPLYRTNDITGITSSQLLLYTFLASLTHGCVPRLSMALYSKLTYTSKTMASYASPSHQQICVGDLVSTAFCALEGSVCRLCHLIPSLFAPYPMRLDCANQNLCFTSALFTV